MLYALKIINSLSLSFAVLSFLIAGFGYKGDFGVVFVSACLLIFIINLIKVKRKGNTLKFIGGLSYYSFLDQFRKGMYICLGLVVFSLLSFNFKIFEKISAVYVIIYLVSSVILSRTLRFLEYNKNNRIVNRLNIIYSTIILLSAFVLSLNHIRHAIAKAIVYIYSAAVDLFFHIFWWIIYLVGLVILSILRYLLSLGKNYGSEKQQIIGQGGQKFNLSKEDYKSLLEVIFSNYFVGILLKIAIICLVIYVLYRILCIRNTAVNSKEEYIENREFIFSERKSNNFVKDIVNSLKPKSHYEYIRYYYRKFIKLCIDKKIQLGKSDTTEDINRKSRSIFNKVNLEEFRNIYIQARYGDGEISKDLLKKYISYYKNLK